MAALPLELLINVASFLPVLFHEAVGCVSSRWQDAIAKNWSRACVVEFDPCRVPELRPLAAKDSRARIDLVIWHVLRAMHIVPSLLAQLSCTVTQSTVQTLHRRLYRRSAPCLFDEFSCILTVVLLKGPLPGLWAFELKWVLAVMLLIMTEAKRLEASCGLFLAFCCADLVEKWRARAEWTAHPFDRQVASALSRELLLAVDVLFLDGSPSDALLNNRIPGQLFHFAALCRLRAQCEKPIQESRWEAERKAILLHVENGANVIDGSTEQDFVLCCRALGIVDVG
eukprot:GGOE01014292.1.p1 GENE.GGOE01014292.1~~GGOE01014292.1.p1  ORF type:complete len:284 (-),score=48.62 GGOE01014292.1:145-996(-)